MPIFFANLAAWLASFLGTTIKQSAVKISAFIAAAAVILIFTVAFFGAIFTLLTGVSATVPSTAAMVWGWVMPANAYGCLSAILVARILRAGYDYKVQLMMKKSQAV